MVRTITLSEVQQHDASSSDPWLIVSGKVLAIGQYKDEHPGGDEILMEYAGKDATKAFKDAGHGSSAEHQMLDYVVGELDKSETDSAATTEVGQPTTDGEGAKTDEKCSIQ